MMGIQFSAPTYPGEDQRFPPQVLLKLLKYVLGYLLLVPALHHVKPAQPGPQMPNFSVKRIVLDVPSGKEAERVFQLERSTVPEVIVVPLVKVPNAKPLTA
jgi:hypothetical protein